MSRIDELAAALDNHQVTDDEGQVPEETETPVEEPATQEPNADEESVTETEPETVPETVEEEVDLAEDESGQKYIPKKRFDKVYGEKKALERKLEELQSLPVFSTDKPPSNYPIAGAEAAVQPTTSAWDKADILEVKLNYPQFDPKPNALGEPTNPEYSRDLDELAYSYLVADPRITPMKAAQKAIKTLENLTKKESEIKDQARKAKISTAETPLSKPVRRSSEEIDPSKMSFEEMENYLKQTGFLNN